MTNTNEMTDLINEAAARCNETGNFYAFAHGNIKGHKVSVKVQIVNTGSKNNQFRKNWTIDGKAASAAKVEAL